MTFRIVKKSYSHNPWRLVDQEGKEICTDIPFDHANLGKTIISAPFAAETREALVNKCLDWLATLLSKTERENQL